MQIEIADNNIVDFIEMLMHCTGNIPAKKVDIYGEIIRSLYAQTEEYLEKIKSEKQVQIYRKVKEENRQ